MSHIRNLKKQARLRAATSGATHQAELNAIAREHGHDSWGSLRRVLQATDAPLIGRNDGHDLDDLIDAFESARRTGGHLVVLRPSHEEEDLATEQLRIHSIGNPQDDRLAGISFRHALEPSDFGAGKDDAPATTIVAGSRGFDRHTSRGHFVVHGTGERLSQINALYSRRDQHVIHATTAVRYALPRPGEEAISLSRTKVGATTIRKSTLSAQNTDEQDRDDVCWVCLASFGRAATSDEIEGSPLGGPFSSPKCEACRTTRATTRGQSSRMIMNRGLKQCLTREESGSRPGPIHVFADGIYVPLREWAASPALAEYERRWRAWEADTSGTCPAQ